MLKSFYLKEFIETHVIERQSSLFKSDIAANYDKIAALVSGKSVLIIGGAGTIGMSFLKAILPFEPASVIIADTSENALAELIRDTRSDVAAKVPPRLIAYPMDFTSRTFSKILALEHFDIVANFAAHKHVRTDKDVYAVEAMLINNVLSARYLLRALEHAAPSHFFSVSTDKAANPVNIMGASKKLMEAVIFSKLDHMPVTTARFANVAFSNGSLPAAFLERIQKRQPISAPNDIKRYFISPEESGEICLLSCMLGEPGDIMFPRLHAASMKTFAQIAIDLLGTLGYTPRYCSSEEEARQVSAALNADSEEYPVFFFTSDTTGEKPYEEFYTDKEEVDWNKFQQLGIIKNSDSKETAGLERHLHAFETLFLQEDYSKMQIVKLLEDAVPSFKYMETGKYLDEKM